MLIKLKQNRMTYQSQLQARFEDHVSESVSESDSSHAEKREISEMQNKITELQGQVREKEEVIQKQMILLEKQQALLEMFRRDQQAEAPMAETQQARFQFGEYSDQEPQKSSQKRRKISPN